MIIEETLFKTNKSKLFKYLLKVNQDSTYVLRDVSLSNEKCLEILSEIILKMNELMYFSQDAPDDNIVENWECCKIKLCEVGSLIMENNGDLNGIKDDLEMNNFIINKNVEENYYEL